MDGIYIETKEGRINIYCENPNKVITNSGTRGGETYGIGHCEWIALKRLRQGMCDDGTHNDKRYCENPRNFYGSKIVAKIDGNNTVYEFTVNDKLFYQYDEMVLHYKDEAWINVMSTLFIAIIMFLFGFVGLLFYRKQQKSE